jgi:hypothetical protein
LPSQPYPHAIIQMFEKVRACAVKNLGELWIVLDRSGIEIPTSAAMRLTHVR